MSLYRCTRNAVYKYAVPSLRDRTKERQGHYIHANSKQHALEIMEEKFPDEISEGFTVQLWERKEDFKDG